MKMFKEQLFLLLIIYIRNSSCAVDAMYDFGREIWKLHLIIDKITSNSSNTVNRLLTDNILSNQEIRYQMDKIHKQLDPIEDSMKPKIIHDLFNSWPSSVLLYKYIDTVEIFVGSIDEYYKEFRRHLDETSYDSDLLRNFLEANVPNIEDSIHLIRTNMIDRNEIFSGHQSLVFAFTGRAVALQPEICSNTRIISHFLVQLFRMVMIAEKKGNIMLAIERLRRLPQIVGWMDSYSKEQFDRQFRLYVNIFSENMQQADAIYLRACDPPGNYWIRDESFYELEGTFQAAIFHYDPMKCEHVSCFDAWHQKAGICDAQYYDARSGCSGTLSECAHLYTMQACILKSGPHKFQYVNSSEHGLLGENSECPKDDGYIINAETSGNSDYTTCACNCYGSHTKIGLFLVKSMMEWNMVITGVRFVRKNQILYIQAREGRLGAHGHVYQHSQRWILISKYIRESQSHPIDEESRVFFVDDVRLPPGFVLTGIKFNRVTRRTIAGFAIEIFGVPFDYKTGKLNCDPQFLLSKQASDDNFVNSLSFVAISSVHGNVTHTPSPKSMNYVTLGRSGLQEDFGQSTLPLFDAVPITIPSPSLLGGIGIFHKGAEGYAGFISLRVYGIRYAKYFADFQSIYMKNHTTMPRID